MNKTELEYEIELKEILNSSELFRECLDMLDGYPVSDIWLTGGIIRNIVWNKLHGYDETYGIDDIDVIFHSKYVSKIYDRKLSDYIISFTNQNDIHLWLNETFGTKFDRFESCEDALISYTDTCSAILVRRVDGELDIKSHSGLGDLMRGVIRPITNVPEMASQYKNRLIKWKLTTDYPLIKAEKEILLISLQCELQ